MIPTSSNEGVSPPSHFDEAKNVIFPEKQTPTVIYSDSTYSYFTVGCFGVFTENGAWANYKLV